MGRDPSCSGPWLTAGGADTIVYKYRQPAYWYFMSVDGSIKMKQQKNITNAKILEAFSKRKPGEDLSGIVAYYISPVESDRGVTGKTTKH